ncbi:TetR/AcrR family transcriptional regulator [Nonomuraea soli]|uniref:AcrR family transcriptional regulator n=1 Tax=Nonomuraea soli TaxID=1032476 RepID=A0A7W0CJC1_9ACTN|nr:TetR/AcrR family transcriptional regulator [Nonomuraea soli]MBA2892236.1 AcrR family transcriptional regulator [Nonomuraea soli]
MSIQARKERERAERERRIITTARELAEAEGWDAVTTRRLAAEIEYSQPVLYSHFKGLDAIMAVVAVEGFAELAQLLHEARVGATTPEQAVERVGRAYSDFADAHPALYEAMFIRAVDLPFATPQAPEALQAGYGELREAMSPLAGDDNVDVLTETFWGGLHGMVTLQRSRRLNPSTYGACIDLLIKRFIG